MMKPRITHWGAQQPPMRRSLIILGIQLVIGLLVLIPAVASARAGTLHLGPALRLPRAAHTATTLQDGRVLITGGCTVDSCELTADGATSEIYDPEQRVLVPGPSMRIPRVSHAAQLLPDGRVLVIGGWTPEGPTPSTELFDPTTDTFSPGPELTTARADPVVVLLLDGRVLVAGGDDGEAPLASAELFDPVQQAFTPTAPLATPRTSHAGELLPDGRVLIMGGSGREGHVVASAEIYDPATEAFLPTGSLATARYKFGAVGLRDGRVLVVGGTDARDAEGAMTSTEIYDPVRGAFQAGPALHQARYKIAGALVALPDDRVLIAGGAAQAELLSARERAWQELPLGTALAFPTASRLTDGAVFITGGYDGTLAVSRQSWIYQPG